jgi:hypothetical protein
VPEIGGERGQQEGGSCLLSPAAGLLLVFGFHTRPPTEVVSKDVGGELGYHRATQRIHFSVGVFVRSRVCECVCLCVCMCVFECVGGCVKWCAHVSFVHDCAYAGVCAK